MHLAGLVEYFLNSVVKQCFLFFSADFEPSPQKCLKVSNSDLRGTIHFLMGGQ